MKKIEQSVEEENSEISSDFKISSCNTELFLDDDARKYKIIRKIGWYAAQLVGCVLILYLGAAVLSMFFSDSTADLLAKGKSLPVYLQGCETITYATKHGTAQCSKFPSMKSHPYFFGFHILALILVWIFLEYSGRKNRGLKFSRYSKG